MTRDHPSTDPSLVQRLRHSWEFYRDALRLLLPAGSGERDGRSGHPYRGVPVREWRGPGVRRDRTAT